MYIFYLPVAQSTKEDVSQNPPCHEADVLQRDFPVVTADQVPLKRKTKTHFDTFTDQNKAK